MKNKRGYLVIFLFWLFVTPMMAQVANTDSQRESQTLQQLITTRGPEAWEPRQVQLNATPPPNTLLVQALPEWTSTGYVALAVDSMYDVSFHLNEILGTQDKLGEILKQDSRIEADLDDHYCYTSDKDELELKERSPLRQTLSSPSRCNEGKLEPHARAQLFDMLTLAHSLVDIVTKLSAYVPVLLLVPSESVTENRFFTLLENLKSFPNGPLLLRSKNVSFIQVPFDSKWIRDYGPFFIRDATGQIIVVDTRYDTRWKSPSQEQNEQIKLLLGRLDKLIAKMAQGNEELENNEVAATPNEDRSVEKPSRIQDDISPSFLAMRMRQKTQSFIMPHPVNVVRPPLVLSGGDFITDGKGTGFTSTDTLHQNGGNVELVNLIFKKYFGIDSMVYLHPLPGNTVKHIDMFLQLAAPNLFLIGTFDSPSTTDLNSQLQIEAQRVIEANILILMDYYRRKGKKVNLIRTPPVKIIPNQINIVCIPMPEILRPHYERLTSLATQFKSLVKELTELSRRNEARGFIQQNLNLLSIMKEALMEIKADLETKDKIDEDDFETLETIANKLEQLGREAYHYSRLMKDHEGYRISFKEKAGLMRERLHEPQKLDRKDLAKRLGEAIQIIGKVYDDLKKFALDVKGDEKQDTILIKGKTDKLRSILKQIRGIEGEYSHGTDLYRTFLNLLLVRTSNKTILLVPSYTDENLKSKQSAAIDLIAAAYRVVYGNLELIQISSDVFIKQLGSIHCLTKSIPADLEVMVDDWNYRKVM